MLRDLIIKSTNNFLPTVKLLAEKGEVHISKRSIPENPNEIFEPIRNWLDEYLQQPQKTTKVIIDLEYFNSSTIRELMEIFHKIQNAKNTELKITWYYYDDDTLEVINDIKKASNLDIEEFFKEIEKN